MFRDGKKIPNEVNLVPIHAPPVVLTGVLEILQTQTHFVHLNGAVEFVEAMLYVAESEKLPLPTSIIPY